MRGVVAAVVLLVAPLAAGCVVLEEDLDGDGDPDRVLLTEGDVSPMPPASSPSLRASPPYQDAARDGRLPGLGMMAMVGQSDRFTYANATAGNDGDTMAWVRDGCAPWTFKVLDAHGGTVLIDDPRVPLCPGDAFVPFAPGARAMRGHPWDGRHWIHDGGGWTLAEAPAGDYVWRVAFRAFLDEHGREDVLLLLDLPFRLGEPGAAPAPEDGGPWTLAGADRRAGSEGLFLESRLGLTVGPGEENRTWRFESALHHRGEERWLRTPCGIPFRHGLFRDGLPVQHRPVCEEWQVRAGDGYDAHDVTVWDGTVLGSDGSVQRAAPGRYQWRIEAEVVDEATGWPHLVTVGYDLDVP